LPAFYTQAVHFPWERVAEEPALFTRRMFVRLSQLPSIRVLAQPMRSAEILVSPLPQQVHLANPENGYLRRLERSDSEPGASPQFGDGHRAELGRLVPTVAFMATVFMT
jgi:hypothetical protein